MILTRRKLIVAASGSMLAAPALAQRQRHFRDDPFSLGVASGYPRPDAVVLWTRLAPDPLEGGGMRPGPVQVAWEVAADEAFTLVIRRGVVTADERSAHSVHAEVAGLQPGRWYWYRFTAGNARSPVGRTRTAPGAGAPAQRLRLAMASCAQYEQGYFSAYRHMANEQLDLVLHLGDYIYELSWGRSHVRKHNTGIPTTLAEFRDRYALYKSDDDLQAAHASFPWMVVWDDHEVADDYTNDRAPRMTDPDQFLKVRAAAYQAWYEHMPVPLSMAPSSGNARIYGRYGFGDLAEILLLDDRQFRAPHACLERTSSPRTTADCEARRDPARSMLGMEQEAWLDSALEGARGRWTLIAQQTLMAELPRTTPGQPSFWMDGWDGYPEARQRLLDAIVRHKVQGPMVLGADLHSFWVTDLPQRFGAASPPIASEIVATSITSDGPNAARLQRAREQLPYVKFADGSARGYVALEIGRDQATAHFRTVSDVRDRNAALGTLAAFAVDQRQPGAKRA